MSHGPNEQTHAEAVGSVLSANITLGYIRSSQKEQAGKEDATVHKLRLTYFVIAGE